jgi:hypothetical protein
MRPHLFLIGRLIFCWLILLISVQSKSQPAAADSEILIEDTSTGGTTGERPFVISASLEPGFNVEFKLQDRQEVYCELVSTMGRRIKQENFHNVLDETYLLKADDVCTGVYLLRFRIDGKYYVTRVFLNSES